MGLHYRKGCSQFKFPRKYIDNRDAKMYMFEEQYETLGEGEISEKRLFGLDNQVYKPKY